MGKINWSRVILCGVLTAVVWTVLSALSTWYVGADFNSAVPGNKIFAPSAGLAAFLLTVNLAGGIWAMWLYAAIRPRYGGKNQLVASHPLWSSDGSGCKDCRCSRVCLGGGMKT